MLRESLAVVDETAASARAVPVEYRKATDPQVTGVEALYASLDLAVRGQARTQRRAERSWDRPSATWTAREGVGFMTIGSENDDVAFMAMVESVVPPSSSTTNAPARATSGTLFPSPTAT